VAWLCQWSGVECSKQNQIFGLPSARKALILAAVKSIKQPNSYDFSVQSVRGNHA
jgi:hypothetical protein